MSLFAKTGPWAVALLSAAATVFGQANKCAPKSYEQGQDMAQSQMMAGYNAPARIDVRGSWDVYASAAFTYWQPVQDNMELGVVSDQTNTAFTINGNFVNMYVPYKPGFQVALGMNFDHDAWDSLVQYTWFRGSHTIHTNLDAATPAVQLVPAWTVGDSTNGAFINGSESWQIHMDILDWQLARAYFVGTKLSFRPYCAARGAWIRQQADVSYTNEVFFNAPNTVTGRSATVQQTAHSWAVGPRAGLNANWMLGDGFRFYSNGGADILFTQYTKLKFNETYFSSTNSAIQSYAMKQVKLNTFRSHMDLELGLGWGSYFDNNNWHVDLAAGYTFQVFFDQNMFRRVTSDAEIMGVSFSPNGNLYIHGLTATARLDF